MASKGQVLENINEAIAMVATPDLGDPLSIMRKKTDSVSRNSPSTFQTDGTHNVSELAIAEDHDMEMFTIDGDEKHDLENLNIGSPVEDVNILWEGTIFENVQSLRHFKDGKSYVDHVLKTGDLQTIESYFRWNILEYQLPKERLVTSQSFRSLSSLANHSEIQKLVNESPRFPPQERPKLKRLGSFPNVTSLSNKYRSVMDQFMKSR